MDRRRIRKRRIIKAAAAVFLLAAVLIIVLLFRVKRIDVYGNTRHTANEISSGLMQDVIGDNTLYLMWKYRDGEVPEALPFLNSLQVQMKSPFRIQVTVAEKELAGYVDQGDLVYFDSSGVVLQITDEVYDGIPVITGVSMEEAVLYQKLPTQSASQRQTVTGLLQLLKDYELEVQEIRFSETMEITAFIGKVEARLGQNECLEEKVANLKSIMEKLSSGERGVLHLESFTGGTQNVTFSPSEVTEAETEQLQSESETEAPAPAAPEDESVGASLSGYGNGASEEPQQAEESTSSGDPFMAFDSNGTLRYDVRVVNGAVVDGSGNPVPGCTVNEQGYVVDAYMNVIDPATGQPIQ